MDNVRNRGRTDTLIDTLAKPCLCGRVKLVILAVLTEFSTVISGAVSLLISSQLDQLNVSCSSFPDPNQA